MQSPEPSSEPAPSDSREFVYELKFFIAREHADALKEWVRARLAADLHGGGSYGDTYQVSSLYFDTTAFAVLARQGSYARSKYRVRRYNQSDTVYLERKTRGQYRVFKRRTATGIAELARLQTPHARRDWDGHWFHRRLLARGLGTVSRVDYLRLARVGRSAYGPVRLTLDQQLQAWSAHTLSFETCGHGVALSAQQLILELKFGHAMPAVFKELIREFAPRLEGISKYRLACNALGLAPAMLAAEPRPPMPPVMPVPQALPSAMPAAVSSGTLALPNASPAALAHLAAEAPRLRRRAL